MLQTNIGEDLEVVRPCRVGEVCGALGVRLVELLQEKGAQVYSAGAGDCLQTGDLRTVSYVSRHGGESYALAFP